MSATALAHPTRRLPLMREARPALALVPPAPQSLAELIDTAWAGLGAEAPIACPICDGPMTPRLGATGVAGGKCRDCGTELT